MTEEIKELREIQVVINLLYNVAFRSEVTQFLQVQDFVNPEYRKIYIEVLDSIARNTPLDLLEVREKTELVSLPTPDQNDTLLDPLMLARRLHEEGNKYRVKIALDNFLAESHKKDFPFDEKLDDLKKQLDKPVQHTVRGYVGGEAITEFVSHCDSGNIVVGKTGIKILDEIFKGLELSHIYSFIAAPGVGKSMMGIQIMDESMKMGSSVMYVSNEMSSFDIVSRLISRESQDFRLSSQAIRRKEFDDELQEKSFHEAANLVYEKLDKTHSVILDKATNIYETIKAIRYHVLKENIKLVVIDHLHNFHGKSDIFDRISEISHILQQVAQELNIAMIILAQMSSESTKQKDVEMMTAKGAKDVEEVSNVMVVLKRKRVKESLVPSIDENPSFMNITIVKNRDGHTGQTYAYVSFPTMILAQHDSGNT